MKKPNQQQTNEINSAFSKAGPYLNIGYFFIGAFILFGYVGFKIDEIYQFKSIFLLIGLFLAFGLGFYNMFKVLADINNKDK